MRRARHSLIVGGGVAIALLSLVVAPPSAHACSVAGPSQHRVDTSLAGMDTTPPVLTAPTTVEFSIHESAGGGCGAHSSDSCEGVDLVILHVTASDDHAPPERIGYRLTLVEGVLPSGIALPSFDTDSFDGGIAMAWDRSKSADSFRFDLSVVPIDEAGNLGEAQRVSVQHSAQGACALAGGRQTAPGALALGVALAALAMCLRRGRAIKD